MKPEKFQFSFFIFFLFIVFITLGTVVSSFINSQYNQAKSEMKRKSFDLMLNILDHYSNESSEVPLDPAVIDKTLIRGGYIDLENQYQIIAGNFPSYPLEKLVTDFYNHVNSNKREPYYSYFDQSIVFIHTNRLLNKITRGKKEEPEQKEPKNRDFSTNTVLKRGDENILIMEFEDNNFLLF